MAKLTREGFGRVSPRFARCLSFFFFFAEPRPQSFLLSVDSDKPLARGERHPQRRANGTPARGGASKKNGDGRGNWGVAGDTRFDGAMPGGALDRDDPNFSSSEGSPSHSPTQRPVHAHTAPVLGDGYKRVALDDLFATALVAAAPAPAAASVVAPTTPPTTPARGGIKPAAGQSMSTGKQANKKKGKKAADSVNATRASSAEQYAGGAHHNIPVATALPLPSSLTASPAKSAPSLVPSQPRQQPVAAQQLEQTLKEMLNIAAH